MTLAEFIPTVQGRILLTVTALFAAALSIYTGRKLQLWLSERIRPTMADVLTSFAVMFVLIGLGTIVVDVWGQREVVETALSEALPRERLPELILTIATVVGTHVLSGFLKQLIDEFIGNRDTVTEHQREVTYRVTQLTLWSMAVIVILGIWQVNVSGLLIGAGFLGIVLGMAARQTLGGMLAGFVLMFARPFEVGDWVEIGEREGIVTDITIINTRIRTFEGEYVVVPNDVVRGEMITNRTARGRLRVEVEVGVDYESDVKRAREVVAEEIKDLDELMDVPKPEVVTKRFDESSIVLGVRGWIDDPSGRRRWRAKTAIVHTVTETFERHGIKIPFPQRELSGRAEDGGFRVVDAVEWPESSTDRSEDRGSIDRPRYEADRSKRPGDEQPRTTDDGEGDHP